MLLAYFATYLSAWTSVFVTIFCVYIKYEVVCFSNNLHVLRRNFPWKFLCNIPSLKCFTSVLSVPETCSRMFVIIWTSRLYVYWVLISQSKTDWTAYRLHPYFWVENSLMWPVHLYMQYFESHSVTTWLVKWNFNGQKSRCFHCTYVLYESYIFLYMCWSWTWNFQPESNEQPKMNSVPQKPALRTSRPVKSMYTVLIFISFLRSNLKC